MANWRQSQSLGAVGQCRTPDQNQSVLRLWSGSSYEHFIDISPQYLIKLHRAVVAMLLKSVPMGGKMETKKDAIKSMQD